MGSYVVYTYGGGEALYEVFNAIAAMTGGSDYLTDVTHQLLFMSHRYKRLPWRRGDMEGKQCNALLVVPSSLSFSIIRKESHHPFSYHTET